MRTSINNQKISYLMDNIAPIYDKICQPCSEDRVDFLRSFILDNIPEHSVIVDAACSTGETLLQLNLDNYILRGIDLSQGMVIVSQNKAKESGRNITFEVDDMLKFHTIDGLVDLVYNNSLVWLESIDDLKLFILRTCEVLKSGGYFIIDINNPDTFIKNGRKLLSSCVKTDNQEIYKSTLFHDLDIDYTATQLYSMYDYESGEVKSYASQIKWNLYDIFSVTELLEQSGFEVITILGDYKSDVLENVAYIQIVSKKRCR